MDLAEYYCAQHFNNQCAPDFPVRGVEGALTVPVPGSGVATILTPTTDPGGPGFCCNAGTGTCIGGTNDGAKCVDGSDCNSGVCTEGVPEPWAQAFGPFWFKFAPPAGVTTVGVNTCTSNSPALDSVVQVFAATDHSSQLAECNSLVPIGCNDDSEGCGSIGRNSRLCLHGLTPGETYYIELAAKTEDRLGLYVVTISTSCTGETQPCTNCPPGEISFVDPPDHVVDARIPHKPNGTHAPYGIRSFTVSGPAAAPSRCWTICESDPASTIQIADVIEEQPGTYRIELNRPITAGGAAFLSYRDDGGQAKTGRFIAHPANADGDGHADGGDILGMVDHLNGVKSLPWGLYSGDIDRSGAVSPADILSLIDLLNGNGFAAWYGTALPDAEGCP